MTTDTTNPAAPPPHADFAALDEQARELEGAAVAATEQREAAQAVAQVQSAAEELLGALQMVRMMAAPLMTWWPEFGSTWGDGTLSGMAEAGAQIMQRHGWTMGDAWSALGPYIALIGATLPPSLLTWQAIQNRRLEARRERAQPAPN